MQSWSDFSWIPNEPLLPCELTLFSFSFDEVTYGMEPEDRCAPLSLPEETQSHSSNPKILKKSRICRRSSSLGESYKLIFL